MEPSFIETYEPLVQVAAFACGWVCSMLGGLLIVQVAK